MAQKKEALIPAPEQSLMEVPEYLLPSNDGRELIDADDISVPRLFVMNALSKQVSAGEALQGDLLDSVTGNKLYSSKDKTPLRGVFLAVRRQRTKWRPRGQGEGIECHSGNGRTALQPNGIDSKGVGTKDCGSCLYATFTKNEKGETVKPLCTEYREFLFLPDGYPMPLVISMGKAAAKSGKKLVEKLNADMGMTNRPLYAFMYEVSSEQKSSKGNTWWEFSIKPAGFPSKPLYERAMGLYGKYKESLSKQDYRAQEQEADAVPHADEPGSPAV